MGDRHFSVWPERAPREITLPETSIWFNLEVSAARFPQRPAFVFYDGQLSYAEFKRRAEALAGYLQHKCGVKPGDRVALYTQNSPQYVIGYYGILRAGGMVVPVNPMNVSAELDYLMEDSGANVLVGTQELFHHVQPLLESGKLQHAIVGAYADYIHPETDLALPPDVAAARQPLAGERLIGFEDAIDLGLAPQGPAPGPDDLCVMPYTSGTTGNPKGCIHTHRSVMHTAVAGAQWRGAYQDECLLAVVPLFHVTGMQGCMNSPVYAGATTVLLPRWNREVAAKLIARYRVTGWTSVPTMVVDLLSSPNADQYDLSSLRSIGGGGAAMPEAIAHKLENTYGLKYLEGYGLSETIAATHINPERKPKRQCLGIPIFNVDSRVVDPDTLQELGPKQTGEIVTHGPQVFQGYWNRPEANASSFVELDGKRFFRTGDLGQTDEEGYFYMVDRLKRMINAAGFKVWPAEVESKLYAHPAIKEAAIIASKDPRRGENVKAVVVLNEGAALDAESLISWCREHMSAYKVPRLVEFVDALPKSGSGKIQWRILQEKEDAVLT